MSTAVAFDPSTVAAELRRAERQVRPVELLTARWPRLTWADARAVALARDRSRETDGDVRIGYKLGWTSAAMREAFGVARPNWGTLWRSQLVVDATIGLDELLHPKVEPELVFRCAADLAADVSPAEVAEMGEWAVGLEVVDPRFPSFDFDWLDNTADNSSAARVVVGEFSRPTAAPSSLQVDLEADGERRTGSGAAAMGDPCAAVAWLARSLTEVPATLRRGDLVFTGGLTAPFDVTPGVAYRAECDELGAATCRAVA